MSLCIAAGALLLATIAGDAFELRWTHSVERTEWRELWTLTPAGLVFVEGSVAGSGAGIDIPEGAVLRAGRWHYRRDLAVADLLLPDSAYSAPLAICPRGLACRPLPPRPDPAEPYRLAPCR